MRIVSIIHLLQLLYTPNKTKINQAGLLPEIHFLGMGKFPVKPEV